MPRFTLRINGTSHQVDGDPDDSLLSILRDDLGLTGTKYGCGEGQCGACTVFLGDEAVRSCVTPLRAAAARPITTVEGLAQGERLHPVQQAFLDAEAFQCGYCTPGMVMGVVALLRRLPNPSEADIARELDRHLCRCGAFPRIVKAVRLAADRLRTSTAAEVRR